MATLSFVDQRFTLDVARPSDKARLPDGDAGLIRRGLATSMSAFAPVTEFRVVDNAKAPSNSLPTVTPT